MLLLDLEPDADGPYFPGLEWGLLAKQSPLVMGIRYVNIKQDA